MSAEVPFDLTLADRYLAGECTPDEAALVKAQFARGVAEWNGVGTFAKALELRKAELAVPASPGVGQRVRKLAEEGGAGASRHPKAGWGARALLRQETPWGLRVLGRRTLRKSRILGSQIMHINTPTTRVLASRSSWTSVPSVLLRRGVRIGGMIAVAALMVFWGYARRKPSLLSAPSTRTYVTIPGQQATVHLVDGSRVVLGPATTLVTRVARVGEAPTVMVTGEALFTVAHRQGTVFVVRTEHAVAHVLGTTFSVRQYATDRCTQVIVSDGRVSVRGVRGRRNSADEIILTSRMLGVVDDSGHVRVAPDIIPDDAMAWANGRLVFRNTPVPDVLAELSRSYNVELRLADTVLAARSLTWTVPIATRSLVDVLDGLTVMLDVRAVRVGRVITLTSAHAVSSPARSGRVSPFLSPESGYGK